MVADAVNVTLLLSLECSVPYRFTGRRPCYRHANGESSQRLLVSAYLPMEQRCGRQEGHPAYKKLSVGLLKGKIDHAQQESVGGCSSPSSRPSARRWRTINVCDAWPVRHQTYGYLPSPRASPLIGWYQIILLGDRGTLYVNNLPMVALDSGAAGIRTRGLLIASPAPCRYATEPHCWFAGGDDLTGALHVL